MKYRSDAHGIKSTSTGFSVRGHLAVNVNFFLLLTTPGGTCSYSEYGHVNKHSWEDSERLVRWHCRAIAPLFCLFGNNVDRVSHFSGWQLIRSSFWVSCKSFVGVSVGLLPLSLFALLSFGWWDANLAGGSASCLGFWWCVCWFLWFAMIHVATCVHVEVFLIIASSHVRTEPQSVIGHTGGKKTVWSFKSRKLCSATSNNLDHFRPLMRLTRLMWNLENQTSNSCEPLARSLPVCTWCEANQTLESPVVKISAYARTVVHMTCSWVQPWENNMYFNVA